MAGKFLSFRVILILLLVSGFINSCHWGSKDFLPLYNQYKFDTSVIAKLPVYDSLVEAIQKKSAYFQQRIDEKASYRSFTYRPSSDDADVVKKLPPDIAPEIDKFYTLLGAKFIYGFDVFKDSSVKIYIRRSESDSFQVDILEHLSYFPAGAKMQKRTFPVKDTILNKQWQYWIEFYRPRISF